MEKGNTKQEILSTALNLFSIRGYEATSVSEIAEAVGIRKSSLYSHFTSKQDILDEIIVQVLKEYDKHAVFALADWENAELIKGKSDITLEEVLQLIIEQVRYILHDPMISRARKMLTIEQFQNEQMSKLQTKQNYSDVLRFFSGLVRVLIANGRLIDGDVEMMTAELCLPVSVWINVCDREPLMEDEIMQLIERHVRFFFKTFATAKD